MEFLGKSFQLIYRGANLKEGDHQHKTPLIAAILYKNPDILSYFTREVYTDKMKDLSSMVDVDMKNIIHFAILSRDNLIISSVLDWLEPHRGLLSSLLRGKDYKGNTPLHLAAQLGRLEDLTQRFVSLHSSQDLLLGNDLHQTSYHVAAKSGSLKMVKVLHARDEKEEDLTLIHKKDIDQNSPLHLAAINTVLLRPPEG